MTKEEWGRQEERSPFHLLAVGGFFLLLFMASSLLVEGRMVWAAYGLFFLVTAWPLLKVMIVITLILSVLAAVFPPLAPFVLGLMVLFFFLRIRLVWKHRWPMLFGLLFYGAGVGLGLDARILHLPQYFLWHAANFDGALWLGAAVNGVLGALVLHGMLIFLYGRGYSAVAALGLMGSVPLVLLAFILPFLKIAGAEGLFGDTMVFHSAPVGAGGVPAGEGAPMGNEPVTGVPLHHVDGYVRSGPSGPVYVGSHWQTNPDGIVENNLSYQGISLPTPNPSPADPAPAATESIPESADIYPGDVEKQGKKREMDHE